MRSKLAYPLTTLESTRFSTGASARRGLSRSTAVISSFSKVNDLSACPFATSISTSTSTLLPIPASLVHQTHSPTQQPGDASVLTTSCLLNRSALNAKEGSIFQPPWIRSSVRFVLWGCYQMESNANVLTNNTGWIQAASTVPRYSTTTFKNASIVPLQWPISTQSQSHVNVCKLVNSPFFTCSH